MIGVKELARLLSVSTKTIYAMVEADQIPCYRIGCGRGTLRFDPDEVKRILKQRPQQIVAQLPDVPRRHLL